MDEQTLSRQYRHHALDALNGYWGHGKRHVAALLIEPAADFSPICIEPDYVLVRLPEWAADLAADGGILVPAGCIKTGAAEAWERVDWLLAAFHLLECTAEREHEHRHGPIHSYSFRLTKWDARVWSRAWVNRIALFLRRSVARMLGGDEKTLFGPTPRCRILLTHDVDAVVKTVPIRFKQCAFNVLKSASSLLRGNARAAFGYLAVASRFLASRDQYDHLEAVAAQVKARGLESTFNVFAGPAHARWLFDPGYDIGAPRLQSRLRHLASLGHGIGLHQSFNAYQDAERMRMQRNYLEQAAGVSVTRCRQHWLRFSWEQTWRAQSRAGLQLDMTLGYNDRPGFRAAAALQWRPWDARAGAAHQLEAIPLALMDSHLYDYQLLSAAERTSQLRHWLEEIHAVGGVASVLWHPHTLGTDYGWADGFTQLLDILEELK